jgi:hypothetical protein
LGKRRTYFTEEVQQAMERDASAALALAVKVGIRTGCRPIIEYGSLEARHVEETPRGQLWRFPKEEAKGRQKERAIYASAGPSGGGTRRHTSGGPLRSSRKTATGWQISVWVGIAGEFVRSRSVARSSRRR